MLTVLSTISPIFILIALGYGAVRSGLIPGEMIPALGRLVLYFTLPALIFSTLIRINFTEVLEPAFLLAYGLGSVLVFIVGIVLNTFLIKRQNITAGIKALGMALPNSAFMGYPVLLQVMGEAPTIAFSMALMVENIIMFPLAMTVIERREGRKGNNTHLFGVWKNVLIRVLKNPIILAILAGVSASMLALELPQVIDRSLHMLSQASVTVALFYIGGSLVGAPVRGNIEEMGLVMLGKLIVHPLLVLILVWVLPDFDHKLQLSAVLLAAMPMMTMYPVIGANYGYRDFCAGTLMATTAVSFLSISIILMTIS